MVEAQFQIGFANPIDAAIVAAAGHPPASTVRLDEIPYDFARKRLSVLPAMDAQPVIVTKGALAQVLAVCTRVTMGNGDVVSIEDQQQAIQARYAAFSARGLRTPRLAMKAFLLFSDPPKTGIAATVAELRGLGVALKIITGDNPLVAQAVAAQVGLSGVNMVSGQALRQVSDDALPQLARDTDIFAEVEPNQKERIIRALRKARHVVGYMGDGINDAPALHAADVGLSVQGAADVAKQAADIVLLEPDLAVLADGVRVGELPVGPRTRELAQRGIETLFDEPPLRSEHGRRAHRDVLGDSPVRHSCLRPAGSERASAYETRPSRHARSSEAGRVPRA